MVMDEQVTAAGRKVGIEFRYDLQKHTPNTFDSHRLVWLAGASGVQDAVVEGLFRAYFCEGADFSNHQKLVEVGVSAGIDPARLKHFFAGDEGVSAVGEEERQARVPGIPGVPFYVVNETVSFSGAQLAETFLEALHRTRKPAWAASDKAASVCGIDGCEIPQ